MSHKFGKYEILSRLGGGGMGVVYLARDTVLGRLIALKLLSQQIDKNSVASRRFLHEAQVAAAMSHPNIVILYDFGQAGEHSFIAMEYLEGESLQVYIERKIPLRMW